MSLRREAFGQLDDGRAVERITLRHASGLEAAVLTYGATWHSLLAPDREGTQADILLGHDGVSGYERTRGFYGATIGRYANRIAKGRFALDGETFVIPANDGPNALHGGPDGFDRRIWQVGETGEGDQPFATLHLTSPDGDQGFPGTLQASVTYRLLDGETLEIAWQATTDRTTVVNLTNHAFFNLGGAARVESVLDHELMVSASLFTAIDETSIPLEGTGSGVAGTPFDLREGARIGDRVREAHEQLRRGRGIDHNFVLDGWHEGGDPVPAAVVFDPETGRTLELLTDQPGLQVYTGNFLDGTVAGKNGQIYRMGDALCLEPQRFPDTPNRPDFPSARLEPGETYRHRSRYRFSVR
jgi:aldose 1-epimerase